MIDFSLTNKLSCITPNDYLEGEFKFIASELLYLNDDSFAKIDLKKCDVFAFGLTMIDVLLGELTRRPAAWKGRGVARDQEEPRELVQAQPVQQTAYSL